MVEGLLNTLNNPMRLRARVELGYAQAGSFSVNSFVNWTNGYTNTTLASAPSVPAFSTVDLTARWEFGRLLGMGWSKGLNLSVSAQNLFDKQPPYVQNGTLAFDPQNTSAIGRFVALTVSGSW
jgi:iron complex outermembrane receptor protein